MSRVNEVKFYVYPYLSYIASNVLLRAYVHFTRVNKINAIYKVSRVNEVKFYVYSYLSYIASNVFLRAYARYSYAAEEIHPYRENPGNEVAPGPSPKPTTGSM